MLRSCMVAVMKGCCTLLSQARAVVGFLPFAWGGCLCIYGEKGSHEQSASTFAA